MRKVLGIIASVLTAFGAVSCVQSQTPQEELPITIYDGPVDLVDQGFGMYYGDKDANSIGVYNVVLSDAVCCRDGYGAPYLDSEGDMLVLEFLCPLQGAGEPVMIPSGEYAVSATKSAVPALDAENSYVKKMVGHTQYHYSIKAGSVTVSRRTGGGYDITTKDMVLVKGDEEISVQYSYSGELKFDEWSKIAAQIQGIKDDIIDMPFPDVSAIYYGNLFGYGTGNYVINLATEGFMDDETGSLPGVALILNMFGELVAKDNVVLLEEGTYTVYPSFNASEFSMLYGLDMDGLPFGTYLVQVDSKGNQSVEYINGGTVEVKRTSESYGDVYELAYDLTTGARSIKGIWKGELDFVNSAEDSGRVILSTLDGDVECDMHRIESGRMYHVETLKTTAQEPVDIAEAWQLWLEPVLIKGEHPEGNGDVMILEFVVPLGSKGDIAPEINREYSYRIQPDLSMDEQLYQLSVSRMGRPYDDIFYQPNWDKYTYMTGWDARRGFTWDGGFRGNWYLHYMEGTYQNMDEMAPAVKGTVKVSRLTDYSLASGGGRQAEFRFVWDLFDDAEASYNITGEWTGPVVIGSSVAEL